MNEQRLHLLAVDSFRKGETSKWVTCMCAHEIVGRFEEGATVALASDLRLSTSYVRRLARAYYTYLALRPFDPEGVHYLRRNLTIGHFAAIGELWRRYEFSPQDALEILQTIEEGGGSVELMRSLVDGMYGDQQVDEWFTRSLRIQASLDKLQNDYAIPPKLRRATKRYLSILEHFVDLYNLERSTSNEPDGSSTVSVQPETSNLSVAPGEGDLLQRQPGDAGMGRSGGSQAMVPGQPETGANR